MKRILVVFASIIMCIMVILFVFLRDVQLNERASKRVNLEYEAYLGKEIVGTDIGTVINKAINNNEKNNVEKDEKGLYIDNGVNSVKIDIDIKINNTTYPMEKIYTLGTSEFIKNFNTILFRGRVEGYHSVNGQISKIIFEQIEQE